VVPCAAFEITVALGRTELMDLGRWTTYRLQFDGSTEKNEVTYDLIRSILADYNIQVDTAPIELLVPPSPDAEAWRILDVQPAHWNDTKSNESSIAALSNMFESVHLSFPVRYQLEVCISRGYINEYTIREDFLKTLSEKPESSAVALLERVADMKLRVYIPMDIFKIRVPRRSQVKNLPKSCAKMRSATVTPSNIYFSTPAVEVSNRVMRRFVQFQDRFLRVRFSDELAWGKIYSVDDNTKEEVFARIKRALRNGIVLGDRKYEFLAFGSSQFREHGAYFFASTAEWTAAGIRAWLGDLQAMPTVAKWCSRLGLSFSTTRAIPMAENPTVETKADIIRNGYTFTDGVGMISPALARVIAVEFSLPSDLYDPPSVIQFRMGGCKGILAVDPKLDGTKVVIRPSQYKFAARLNGLEAIRVSQFCSASTNRQLILILSALGIPDEVFTGKLRLELAELEAAMTEKTKAIDRLTKNIDFNQITLMLAGIARDGFMEARDPFILSMLHLWRAWSTKYLKEKAKLSIEKGAYVFGCIDEIGVLRGHHEKDQPNPYAPRDAKEKKLPEIFLRVDPKRDGQYTVVTGVCVLARSPSLHPGDIRVVRAVDRKELYHLNNVVVLPQTGDQDLASMCSGGDLDGDEYLVIWDQDLIPAVQEWNCPPMDFTPEKLPAMKRRITADDIIDFFVTYMKNDRLPTIATNHLAFADNLADGVKDEKCKCMHLTRYPTSDRYS
jgi:RNA-dependent RNA polymerase